MRFLLLTLLALSACGETTPTDDSGDAPVAGEACTTTGADDFQDTCAGDDLLFCVCDAFDGDDCPAGEGTWTRQDILCTCDEWMDGTCPEE